MTLEEDADWWLCHGKVGNGAEEIPLGMEGGGAFFPPGKGFGFYPFGNQEQEGVVQFIFRASVGAVRGWTGEVGDHGRETC